MLRRALVLIRKEYSKNLKRLLALAGAVLLLSGAGAVLVDLLLSFRGWPNIIRSLLLIPLSASIFVLAYCWSFFLHKKKVATDPLWVPYRLRFSLMWRRRMALIAAAVIFVFMYAVRPAVGYTLISACLVAFVVALLAFIRPTRQENMREELQIPDARDLNYEEYLKDRALERREARASKKKRRSREDEDDE